ncbi:MAG: TonB-dependent receptor [Gemmatimonadetes bacterium]|nr:TonB-dependent receptor [Gemmatimonadota bacterium]MBT7861737.1 TonB-dependent receptor [Gemmatimonadota bacterium]
MLSKSVVRLCLVVALTVSVAEAATISGYVHDGGNGESLPFVNVYLKDGSRGAICNEVGYYAIVGVPEGTHTVVSSLIGYETFERVVEIGTEDLVVDVELSEQAIRLRESVVEANRDEVVDFDISPSRMSMRTHELKSAPAAIEADPIRTLMTLPGVTTLSDYSVGLYVRGGTPDQNLVLLDGTDVYNASHLFGLFSTFPADAAKSTELLKGGYPAKYGGRLSSVLNVITNEGNKEEFEGQGGASLLASRLTLQGPVARGSWLISGRRTHLDPLIAVARKAADADRFAYNFYDLQGKTHQVLSHSDQWTLAAYTGQDNFDFRIDDLDFNLEWGNRTISSKWTHVFDTNLFGNFLFTGSRFKASTIFRTEDIALIELNRLTDLSMKGDINYFRSESHSIEAGFLIKRMSMEYDFGEADISWVNIDVEGFHNAVYLQDNWSLTPRLQLQPGLRFNHFSNGNYTGFSPRLAGRYKLSGSTALKAAIGRYHQYIFRLAREFQGISLLSNVWALADSTAEPSASTHYIVGAETALGPLELDVEGYYKDYDALYEINYDEQESVRIGDIVRRGPGRALGVDFLVRKRSGRQTGWLSVSTGLSERTIEGINENEAGKPQTFRSKFDRSLIVDLVHVWSLARDGRWVLNSRAAFASGQPYTQILGRGEIQVPSGFRWTFEERGELNGVRLPSYQRLDLAIQRRFTFKSWDMSAQLQVINVTNRKNIFNYFWSEGTAHKRKPGSRKEIAMLPMLPSFGIDFHF